MDLVSQLLKAIKDNYNGSIVSTKNLKEKYMRQAIWLKYCNIHITQVCVTQFCVR